LADVFVGTLLGNLVNIAIADPWAWESNSDRFKGASKVMKYKVVIRANNTNRTLSPLISYTHIHVCVSPLCNYNMYV
jgi:hypothetical protein